jgi:hypothetical protein
LNFEVVSKFEFHYSDFSRTEHKTQKFRKRLAAAAAVEFAGSLQDFTLFGREAVLTVLSHLGQQGIGTSFQLLIGD